MALSDLITDPILIVSFDRIEDVPKELAETSSIKKPTPDDAEREAKADIIDRFLSSDSYLKQIRIPIFITDVLNVQMVGTNSSTGKTVTYVKREPKLSNNNNNVSVELTLKNSLGDLSVISDIFSAAFTRMFNNYTTSARASFFGHNICIFNGFLTGVNRATVSSTDQERLNLTFERAADNPQEEEKKELERDSDTPTSAPENILELDVGDNNASEQQQPVNVKTGPVANNVNPNAGGAVGSRVFFWYKLGPIEQMQNIGVPEFVGKETVNRGEYAIYSATSNDFTGELRNALSVLYQGVYLPVGFNGHYPYYKQNKAGQGFAVDVAFDALWLGVESVS